MMRRIIVTAAVVLLLTAALVATASALPGEGLGVAPYGIEEGILGPPVAPPEAPSVPVLTFVVSLVAAAAIMTLGGWLAGASHERRALAH